MMERKLSFSLLEKFRSHLVLEEKSKATIEKYLRDAKAFMEYLAQREITKDIVVAYKSKLQGSGYAVRSVNSMLASINCLLDCFGWSDCKVKSLRLQRQMYCPADKELTKEEYMRLLAASKNNEQLNLVIQTICGTGIRVSELQHFTVEAIRIGEVTVDCKNKTRTIIVPGKLKMLLMNYAKRRRITTGIIFVTRTGRPLNRSNIWADMKKLCETAGIKPSKVFPHNLRKLFARTFYGIEKDIAKLADILGHSSINTTRIYIMTSGAEHRRQIECLGLIVCNTT